MSVLLSSPATSSRVASAKAERGNPLHGLPPLFVENRGQVDKRASFYVQGRDAGVFFTPRGLAMSLVDSTRRHRFGLRLDFLGAGEGVKPVGQARTRAVTSYFRGGRGDWKTNVPTYSSVAYRDLWPGIDLVYSGEGNQLKYNFLVRPGADPRNIHLAWRGASGIAVNRHGQLEVSTPARALVDNAPNTYQRTGDRRIAVKSAYAVDAKSKTYGFRVGGYDRSRPLVIDPAVLVYAGFIGGTGAENGGHVALDGQRNLYVIGSTTSFDFPARVGPDTSFNGGDRDAYVAKVDPSGTGLVYAGFIGGSQAEDPFKIAVDAAGAAYVTGSTSSTPANGFPVAVGPDLTFNGGPQDAFVAKVKPDGTGLDYAGYIGGSATTPPMAQGNEQGNAIALDATGRAYVSGFTRSRETQGFPNGTGFGSLPGYDQTFNGALEAFLVKVKADGSGLDYATYVGGGGADAGTGVSVDASGNAYQNVRTGSNQNPIDATTNPSGGFPVTPGAFDTTFNGGPNVPAPSDTAEVKLNTNVGGAASLVYSTYIGGAGTDLAFSNAIDSAGNVYITGPTDSDASTFPNGQGFGSIPGFDHVLNAGPSSVTPTPTDSFVVKLNASGSQLAYATYVGGSGNDQSVGIDINSAGSAYVSGTTNSGDGTFPAINGPDSTFNGDPLNTNDAFVAKLNPTGTGLDYAGFIGGAGDEPDAVGMKVDSDGNAYIAGSTASTDFPATVGPDLTYNGGSQDAFVAKIAEVGPGQSVLPTSPQPSAAPFADCPIATANVVRGTAASESITGTPRGDRIFAGTGNDTVDGLAGDDCIDLGPGTDRGQGGDGNDLLVGGLGKDRMTGGDGNDRLLGGASADRLIGGFGDDRLHGQSGSDRINGERGRDRINGGSSNDVISGGSSPDRVAGDQGNDRIAGNSGNDSIKGNSGNDRLTGGTGRDRISAGSGNDRINARDGHQDHINCGSGRDTVIADRTDIVSRNCEQVRRRR